VQGRRSFRPKLLNNAADRYRCGSPPRCAVHRCARHQRPAGPMSGGRSAISTRPGVDALAHVRRLVPRRQSPQESRRGCAASRRSQRLDLHQIPRGRSLCRGVSSPIETANDIDLQVRLTDVAASLTALAEARTRQGVGPPASRRGNGVSSGMRHIPGRPRRVRCPHGTRCKP
jgi:hypothetical protein